MLTAALLGLTAAVAFALGYAAGVRAPKPARRVTIALTQRMGL